MEEDEDALLCLMKALRILTENNIMHTVMPKFSAMGKGRLIRIHVTQTRIKTIFDKARIHKVRFSSSSVQL